MKHLALHETLLESTQASLQELFKHIQQSFAEPYLGLLGSTQVLQSQGVLWATLQTQGKSIQKKVEKAE